MDSIRLLFLLLLCYVALPGIAQIDSGKASFYHDNLHGRLTGNGEVYDKNDFTAAHRELPFNSLLLITNRKNGRLTIVRVNDRGPFVKSRVIDLSRSAAKQLQMVPFGIVPVGLKRLTLLDKLPVTESYFREGETWTCSGKKIKVAGHAYGIWKSSDWKHAFYMASLLCIRQRTDLYSVHVSEDRKNKIFSVIYNSEKHPPADIFELWKKHGFVNVFPLRISSASAPHSGR